MKPPLSAAAGAGGAPAGASGNMNGAGAGNGEGAASAAAAGTESSAAPTGIGTKHVHTGEINYVWNHGPKFDKQGFICLYCRTTYNGGGATRFVEHLFGLGNNITEEVGDGEEVGDENEEGDGEAGRASIEEGDDEQEIENERRRSKRGNMKKHDLNSVYY